MKKTRPLTFFLALALLLPMAAQADDNNDNVIHDREWYKAQGDATYFGKKIALEAQKSNHGYMVNTGLGVYYTVLSTFDDATAQTMGFDGYVAAGAYKGIDDNSDDAADDYNFATFATTGSFAKDDSYLYGDGDDKLYEVFIPAYIITNSTNGYSESSPFNKEYSDPALADKTFKVVGVDFAAFCQVTWPRIVLPETVTYIGKCAFRAAGPGNDKYDTTGEGGLWFWNGTDYNTAVSYDSNKTQWLARNNIESIAQRSFESSKFQYFYKLFNPEKLNTLGPVSPASGKDNLCFSECNLKELDLTDFTLITEIPTGAFYRSTFQLTTVTLGGNITEINARAFKQCRRLETATLNCPNLTLLGVEAFMECAQEVSSKTTAIDAVTKRDNVSYGLKSIDLTGCTSLTTLSEQAFYRCYLLKTLKLSESVATIKEQCFYQCGFTGRFDIPDHVTGIEDKAFYENRISYIPISTTRTKTLNLGYRSFLSYQTDQTVECFTTTPPDIIAPSRSFDVPDGYTFRIIVPIGCGEVYKHYNETKENIFSSAYSHHEYRVKFDLNETYTRPTWGLPLTDDEGNELTAVTDADHQAMKNGRVYAIAPWHVFTSSWVNDIYAFRPHNGGSVDTWAAVSGDHTNQAGVSKDLYAATTVSKFANETAALAAELGTDIYIEPRTAHTYHANENVDDVAKIGTEVVKDGVVPPEEGILLTVDPHHPATYLVPLYGDYKYVESVTYLVTKEFEVKINTMSTDISTYTSQSVENKGGRVYAGSNTKTLTKEKTEEVLNQLKDGTKKWVDFRERKGSILRDLYVYNETTGSYDGPTMFAIDEIDINEKVTVGESTVNKYKVDLGKGGDDAAKRCAAYYRIYKVNSEIDWGRAAEDKDYLWSMLAEDGTLRCTNGYQKSTYNGDDAFYHNTDGYWIDIFNLEEVIQEGGTKKIEFLKNHTDRDNVLISRIDNNNGRSLKVYPGWKVVDDSDTGGEYYETGWWEYQTDGTRRDNLRVRGLTLADLQALGDASSVDGFLSFGLFDGCFYPANYVADMKPNKAFFRVHTTNLHSRHKQVNQSGKAVILDESDINGNATGITTVDKPANRQAGNDTWYTVDGRRLPAAPTQKGIYLHNEKKVVIK